MSQGVIYIVYSINGKKQFYDEFLHSLKTLKEHNPNLSVTVFSDKKFNTDLIDKTILMSKKDVGLRIKTNFLNVSPYDKTLYLDTDTHVDYNIEEMFEILDKYELAMAHDFARRRLKYSKKIPEYGKIPYAFSEFNCGILLYKKCDNVKKCFELWDFYHKKYMNICKWDQPAGRIAFWESGVKIHTLPPEYNRRTKQNRKKSDINKKENNDYEQLKTRIYHAHGLTGRKTKEFDKEFYYV